MSKISIVGRGVDPAKHLSLSALGTLRLADKIVGIESEKKFWKELQQDYGIGEIEDLGNLYSCEDNDMVNYHRFVDYVIRQSSEIRHLALLVAGHPRLGVTFVELLKKSAPEEIEIEIIEGISSFDVMINYLGIDPLEQGTALLDANRLLLFQYRIEPALSYFIYHVSSIGNPKTNFVEPALNNRVDLLRDYLLKFYSGDKEAFFCRASNGKNEVSKGLRVTIADLESYLNEIDYSTTLFLPAENPSKLDWDYLSILK